MQTGVQQACYHEASPTLTCFTAPSLPANCSINDITAVRSLGNNCIGPALPGLYIYCTNSGWSRTGSLGFETCHKEGSIKAQIGTDLKTNLGIQHQICGGVENFPHTFLQLSHLEIDSFINNLMFFLLNHAFIVCSMCLQTTGCQISHRSIGFGIFCTRQMHRI